MPKQAKVGTVNLGVGVGVSQSQRPNPGQTPTHTHVCAASTRQHVVGYTHLLLPELTTHACDVHQLLNAQKLDRFRSVSQAMTAEKLLGSFHEFIQSSFVPYYYNLGSNPNQRVILAFFLKKRSIRGEEGPIRDSVVIKARNSPAQGPPKSAFTSERASVRA